MKRRVRYIASCKLWAVAAAMLLMTTISAQKYRTELVPDCGIQFTAPDRLERLPMKLGSREIYQRARLRPKDIQDYVRAQYAWYCDVYSFAKKDLAPEEVKLPAGIPKEMEKRFRQMLAGGFGGKRHTNFKSWLEDQDGIEIKQEAKQVRAKGSKLAYMHWIFTKVMRWNDGSAGLAYCEASVYDFEDTQTALMIEMPLETKKAKKPKSKWLNIIKKVMRSGQACEDIKENASSDKRDVYADTPARKAALKKAKANIVGMQGWDYFTMPNYIVFYSWDFEKPATRSKAKKQSQYYVERLEKMRKLYIESYPLDKSGTKAIMPDPSSIPGIGGPITGPTSDKDKAAAATRRAKSKEKGEVPYSVFRLCATYEQFQKYGGTRGGVVGWYSPSSKELVVFLGGDKMMGAGATETVTFHEGWHQFADLYFHPPESPKRATLQRWFDEGHGDYFGSFRWTSRGWKYVGSDMRYQSCKDMVRKGDYVPFKEIVNWGMRRFYTAKAAYYYAQAFSMIDFMRRGAESKGWDPKWGEILEMYRRVVLVKGDASEAVKIAFRDFKDEDWTAFENAWKAWVASPNFLKG